MTLKEFLDECFAVLSAYLLIGNFSETTLAALTRTAWYILVVAVFLAVVLFLVPNRLLLVVRSWNPLGFLLTITPLPSAVADVSKRIFHGLPQFVQSALSIVGDSAVGTVKAILAPSAVVTWLSLTTVVAFAASSYWEIMRLIRKARRKTTGPRATEQVSMTTAMYMFNCLAVGAYALGLAFAAYKVKYVRQIARVLVPALDPATCAACIVGTTILATLYMVLVGARASFSREQVETTHVQISSLGMTILTMGCILVRYIGARE